MQKIRKEDKYVTEAVITGVVAIAVCMINNFFQQRATKEQSDKTVALIDYKLEELTKQVEKHNGVIDRTYKVEQDIALMDEKIRVANHRIEDLEKEKTE